MHQENNTNIFRLHKSRKSQKLRKLFAVVLAGAPTWLIRSDLRVAPSTDAYDQRLTPVIPRRRCLRKRMNNSDERYALPASRRFRLWKTIQSIESRIKSTYV
jgi:hypothetical protein